MNARQLVLLERAAHVAWAKRSLSPDPRIRLIAVTAEALQALETSGLPHEPISAHANVRHVASLEWQLNRQSVMLAQEVEAAVVERYPAARVDGPGCLSGQGYDAQTVLTAIAERAVLMREAIDRCDPDMVTVFAGPLDPTFTGIGYLRNPWADVIASFALERAIRCEVVPMSALDSRPDSRDVSAPARQAALLLRRRLAGIVRRVAATLRLSHRANGSALGGLRLLMAGGVGYDWAPVLASLSQVQGVDSFQLEGSSLGEQETMYIYRPFLRHARNQTQHPLGVGEFRIDEAEAAAIGSAFDEWLAQRPHAPELEAFGLNLFPAFAGYLRRVAGFSPAIARHADAIAERALAMVKPHAVCFVAICWLAARRMAYRCRQQGVPVVSYQHGGSYGTHQVVVHDQAEPVHSTYFFTYGSGIQPPAVGLFAERARYVPVGSARLANFRIRSAPQPVQRHRRMKVLWVAEHSARNTNIFQIEDTRRYSLQKRCLQLLIESGALEITYRPHREGMSWDGTTAWLKRVRWSSIRIEAKRPLEAIISSSDLVITDTSSGTAWNEVLTLRKPLLLYCDPEQARLAPPFMDALGRACCWCRSEAELLTAIRRLAAHPKEFLEEARQKDPEEFLRTYVLHHDGPTSVERVTSFLHTVCRHGGSVEEWERMIGNVPGIPRPESRPREERMQQASIAHSAARLETLG